MEKVKQALALREETLRTRALVAPPPAEEAWESPPPLVAPPPEYEEQSLSWGEEQGCVSIQELMENQEALAEALSLKPLERKRLAKACAGEVTW